MILMKIQNFHKNTLTNLRGTILKYYSTKSKLEKSKWKSVVGLEIHAQIKSESKLFSGAKTEFGAPVNTCVSLFDASIPGTLPVLNETCVIAGIRTALALSCKVNETSMFDRKHYFYADLPAGYQITQQRAPLAKDGILSFPVFVPGIMKKPYRKSVRLHQLQLEQDSGKSLHDDYAGRSLVDLNRAGIPLMELVFEPDLTDGEEAAALVKELMLILTRLGTCSCKMEEGALRIDANISIHEEGTPLGIRTEVKNIGSVRGVANAISYEIERQVKIKNNGGTIHNETRAWDANSKKTVPMRDKEVQQDYRFMPEPNLPPLRLCVKEAVVIEDDLINVKNVGNDLPELPEETRIKLVNDYNLPTETAIILVNEEVLLSHFCNIQNQSNNISSKLTANLLINDFLTLCNKNRISIEDCKIKSETLAELLDLLQKEEINFHLARLILQEMMNKPEESPSHIANVNDWKQISDKETIEKLCKDIIDKNPKMVKQYRDGKGKILYAFAGEIAKNTNQKVNMAIVVDKLKNLLACSGST